MQLPPGKERDSDVLRHHQHIPVRLADAAAAGRGRARPIGAEPDHGRGVRHAPAGEAPPVRSADGPAAARLEAPAWPEPRTINLPAELLDLTETGITYTSSIEVPETGADFWDMLATALPGDEAG